MASFTDRDMDGIDDRDDNCVEVSNPVQTDEDEDGEGDACASGQAVCVSSTSRSADGGGHCSQIGQRPQSCRVGLLMVLIMVLGFLGRLGR